MLNAIRESLSGLPCLYNEEVTEDEEDNMEDLGLSKLGDDDEPGWVMGTISRPDQHYIESYLQNLIQLDELTTPEWGEASNYCLERYMRFSMANCKVPRVIHVQTDDYAADSAFRALGELLETVDIVPRKQ